MSDTLTDLETPPPGMGSNSTRAGGIAADQLKSIVDRIENVQCEIDELKDDQKEIYVEAKGDGFDVKTLRRVIRERKKTADERAEELAITELYMLALGMI